MLFFFVFLLLGWLFKSDAIWILIFFFYIKLVLFSLKPYRIFLATHVLTFFSDVPLVYWFPSIMLDTIGVFNMEICVLQLRKFSRILSLIPSYLFPLFLNFLIFHFWTSCLLLHILIDFNLFFSISVAFYFWYKFLIF